MFRFDSRTQVIVVEELATAVMKIIQKERVRRAGAIIDHNLAKNARVNELLNELGRERTVDVRVFQSVEPTTDIVDEMTELFRGEAPDILIGIGGGSTLDLTKAVSAMVMNPGKVTDYHGTGKPLGKGIKTILIPSTAGTGAEVTPGAVLVNPRTSFKRALSGDHTNPDYAVLDAELTLSMPDEVTAATGMDALTHSIESYTAKCANLFSRMYSREAFRLVYHNLAGVFKEKSNLQARRNILMGSCLAGLANYNSNTGACHALSYPLGIHHRVPHGVAVGLMIPKVVEINVEKGCTLYADLLSLIEDTDQAGDSAAKARRFSRLLKEYPPLRLIGPDFRRYGITAQHVPFLSERGLDLASALSNNPVDFAREDATRVLEQLV